MSGHDEAVPAVLEAAGIGKTFPGVKALDGVRVDLRAGEVHALLGENGAGKSTLVRILAGIQPPDTGTMRLGGEPYAPKDAAAAMKAGVQVVHQELNLLPNLTVAENLFFQRLPRRYGLVDRRTLNRRAQDLLDEVGLDVRPHTKVERLGIAQMQLLEIARTLWQDCRVLVMDEPTATLTSRETERLFEVIRRVTARGTAVLYISHHLEEVFEIGDRMTVFRNGRHVVTKNLADTDTAEVIRLMVGRDLAQEYPPYVSRPPGDELLRAEDLHPRGGSPVSFALHAGEVVGVAGLVGSGRTETVRALFGADHHDGGHVYVKGRRVRIRTPRDAVRHGISLLTEDRKGQGLVLDMPVAANVTLAATGKVSRGGLLKRGEEDAYAHRAVERLGIRTPGIRTAVRTLSGGNQQKVVLGRWLLAGTDVLVVDEPTRGIDVGARYEIHQQLTDLASAGKALLVVSSDLPELMGICDRILVFSRGRIAGEVAREDFDNSRILALAYSGYVTQTPVADPVPGPAAEPTPGPDPVADPTPDPDPAPVPALDPVPDTPTDVPTKNGETSS
ncbi:ribose import ATP-binding protein RbsA 2 [Streptomyces spiroverticillatus]|uniref:Ribose import ATP-binding protein RbsA 2 n=1 Tax=Streptomyces finlayi TaxID=67296 RepID=A0A919C8F1_9ACTN|nr:sugar ABC transporter ATP-binding protein [Streptomyces finlayi]GHA01261.1 ribose import ATP-binding protein RbsA 2 [Streptomyces spiroverticillatus]GHC85698.1 ribose import ATP-binding protein RbsA 2 [Streptomyces finlayi]